eukprot:766634_1
MLLYNSSNKKSKVVIIMAEEKRDIDHDDDAKDESKSSELRDKFDVVVIKFEANNDNNGDAKCLQITLTDKKENKFQIYEKTFSVNDCGKIKKDAKLEAIPLPKFVNLIMDCLSIKNQKHDIKLRIEHTKYVVINITYAPDDYTQVEFALTIPAKEMREVDLLKLRLKEAEDKIKQLEATQGRPTKWKNAVAQNPKSTTDRTTHNANNCLVSITLPAKAGKYLCQFSFWAHADKHWIYYWFKQGETTFGPSTGCHTPGYTAGASHLSVSNMAIVELNGNEDEQNRTIRLYATGHASYPVIFTNCVLVCEELDV